MGIIGRDLLYYLYPNITSEGFLFECVKKKPLRLQREKRFGARVCRGLRVTWRFDIYTLQSLSLYETGLLSFSRDGALRRSAYRVIVRAVRQLHPNLA